MATYISSEVQLPIVAQQLSKRPRISLDLETTGLDPLRDEILLMAIDEFVIMGNLDLSPFRPLIESNSLPKLIFNASFDGMFLQRRGMLPHRVFDPMIGAQLLKCGLDSPKGTFSLENLLHSCLGIGMVANKAEMQKSFIGMDPRLWVPSVEQIKYAAGDTEHLGRLCDWVQQRLEQRDLMNVWRLENAVTQVIAQMQIQGIPLARDAYIKVVEQWESDFEDLEDALSAALTPAILEVRRRRAEEANASFETWDLQHNLAWEHWEKEFDTFHPEATKAERRKELQARDREWRAAGHPRPQRQAVSSEPINLGSPPQVKQALHELGISLSDKRRTSILRAKVGQGIEVQTVLNQLAAWSKMDKQLGTYGRSMLEGMDDDDRIRCRFSQIIATGRRSSSKFTDEARGLSKGANLQNFPGPTRKLVQPAPDRRFVIGDYSQIELRVAAEFALQKNPNAQDALIRAFRDGQDPHAEMAAVAFGLDLDDLKARVKAGDETAIKQRWAGKTTNFSALFGIAAKTLAVRIHEMMLAQDPDYLEPLTEQDVQAAKKLLEAFRSLNPTILACLADWRRQALQEGYTTTMSGRRRYFELPDRNDPDFHRIRSQIEREAGNQPIQGTSADITKLAEVLIQRAWHKARADAVLINTVHDEIMAESDVKYAPRAAVVVRHHMTAAYKNWVKSVPCEIQVGVQTTWTH